MDQVHNGLGERALNYFVNEALNGGLLVINRCNQKPQVLKTHIAIVVPLCTVPSIHQRSKSGRIQVNYIEFNFRDLNLGSKLIVKLRQGSGKERQGKARDGER